MIDFSQDERYVIAEYIFSYETDVLIKADAYELIDLFNKHNFIDDKEKWYEDINKPQNNVARMLSVLIKEKLPEEQIKSIMTEYYGG